MYPSPDLNGFTTRNVGEHFCGRQQLHYVAQRSALAEFTKTCQCGLIKTNSFGVGTYPNNPKMETNIIRIGKLIIVYQGHVLGGIESSRYDEQTIDEIARNSVKGNFVRITKKNSTR